ncbi:P27 family phage terminase small subunit [uncultured Bacteroides sp.]|uniref:P27 family phage terminase small subunit n=1 Tax=uncultured Bacteroides sp. TaxID=162156 RepID=UPI002600E6BB|nr:P27 family phage terminase small subunit [uncultured Bacteroides sp.]
MVKTVKDYVKEITKTLKANKVYSRGLDMQILSLASAMRNLEMANDQIDGLTETTVYETTRYGEKLAPHPVFKIAKEAQELVTRQMKALGLTVEDLAGDTDDDPLADLTKKLTKKRKQPTIIRPKADSEE